MGPSFSTYSCTLICIHNFILLFKQTPLFEDIINIKAFGFVDLLLTFSINCIINILCILGMKFSRGIAETAL